jgi:23S rRNA pseudouridine1911/1915/1917 synthase
MGPVVYTVPGTTRRGRADKVLAAAFPEHSRVALQRAFAAGLVTRSGLALAQSDAVGEGDRLEFSTPETLPSTLRAVDIPLAVLFEDRHLLAIDKAPGMVVHPGAGTREDTLVHALLAHCRGGLSGVGGVERPGIVHRLDRETSGVILVAKDDETHRGLAAQFAERSVEKEYLALVSGAPALLGGDIRRQIGRNTRQRHRMSVVEEGSGRDAHTEWRIVERYGALASLVRCILHTGRTHQIRVHMKSIGHPLLGDAAYGWRNDARLPRQPDRVMLHAERLAFTHPVTGRRLDIHAPLPADLEAMIVSLGGRKPAAPPRRRAGAETGARAAKPKRTIRKAPRRPSPSGG